MSDVYGPREKTITVPNPYYSQYRIFCDYKKWYVQKPITIRPLYFKLLRSRSLAPIGIYNDAPNSFPAYEAEIPTKFAFISADTNARYKAYSKFKGAVYGDTSQWGENIGQRAKTVDMIKDPALRMLSAWKALRRGDLFAFAKTLNIGHIIGKSRWSKPKDAANLWLLYHFGWDPLVKDIFNAVEILQSAYPAKLCVGRGGAFTDYKQAGGAGTKYDIPEYLVRYLIQAYARVDNPNLNRATQLGVINPATIAWQLTPFSFVVDWFIPVEQFLESWSDFLGITFEDAFYTRSAYARGEQYPPPGYPGYQKSQGWSVLRQVGMPSLGYPLPKAFKGFSVTRGATAISLLIATMSKHLP